MSRAIGIVSFIALLLSGAATLAGGLAPQYAVYALALAAAINAFTERVQGGASQEVTAQNFADVPKSNKGKGKIALAINLATVLATVLPTVLPTAAATRRACGGWPTPSPRCRAWQSAWRWCRP